MARGRRTRQADRVRLLPLLPVPVALLVLAAVRPDLLTGAARSPRAWAVVVAVLLASAVVRRLVRRSAPAAAPWASSAVTLGLLAALVVPSLRETTVVEDFPPVALTAPDPAVDGSSGAVPTPSSTPAASVDEREAAVAAPVPTRAATRAPAPAPTTPPTFAAPAPAPARATTAPTATRVATGSLRGIRHDARGQVSSYLLEGRLVVRFEDVDLQGTPGPSVHLVERGARTPAGGIRLGALKAEHGSFRYPTSADPGGQWTVLVWCDPYDTPIAAADLG